MSDECTKICKHLFLSEAGTERMRWWVAHPLAVLRHPSPTTRAVRSRVRASSPGDRVARAADAPTSRITCVLEPCYVSMYCEKSLGGYFRTGLAGK